MKRIIARLDIKGKNVIRGINLEGLRVVGEPAMMGRKYYQEKIDEIIFLDIVASLYGRNSMFPLIEASAEDIFIPITVGGGLRTIDDVHTALAAGADKITLNSAAVKTPHLVEEIALNCGRQCVVAAIEAKQVEPNKWTAMIENGRESTGLNVVEWVKRLCDLGVGEILLTSIDQDGMRQGFDLPLVDAVSQASQVPVVASGGAAKPSDIVEVFRKTGCDAVALGTCLHFGLTSISEIKNTLKEEGFDVRVG